MTVRRFFELLAEHARAFSTNWREFEAPIWTKVGLALRNRARATFSRRQCCGHLGEPGC